MEDKAFLQIKEKLDKMTVDLMIMLQQMKDLNDKAMDLQRTLQEVFNDEKD